MSPTALSRVETAPDLLSSAADGKAVNVGSHRAFPLQETIDRVLERAGVIGLTRIADLTDMDVTRVPNYAAVCPLANYPSVPGMVTVFGGKGITRPHAKASAVMEAVERFSGLSRHWFTLAASYRDLSRMQNVAHPAIFNFRGNSDIDDVEVLEWVPALSLLHGDLVYVPAWLVFTPHIPRASQMSRRGGVTTGLAAGNTLVEAVLHGIYECVEKDAELTADFSRKAAVVDLDRVESDEVTALIETFRENRLEPHVFELTQDVQIPTFWACCSSSYIQGALFVHDGLGTHLDPLVALSRALTEAAQTRVTELVGLREDLPALDSPERDREAELATKAWYERWYKETTTPCFVGEVPDRSSEHLGEDLATAIDLLVQAGAPDIFVADLTRPELEIPVARVLIPGFGHPRVRDGLSTRALNFIAEVNPAAAELLLQ